MKHIVDHIPEAGIEALKALIGTEHSLIFAPQVEVHFDGPPHCAYQLVFWIDGMSDDFVTLDTLWHTTADGSFDYHTFFIERSRKPGRLRYKRRTKERHGELKGSTSSIHRILGKVERIDILEAHCVLNDEYAKDSPQAIDYDRALRIVGSDGNLLLSTIYESISGAIEISTGQFPPSEEYLESYRVRLSLGCSNK